MPDSLEQPVGRVKGDRPFPWRCPRCLQKAVRPVVMGYRAKAAHDGRTYELDIPDLTIPQCASCGELVFSNRVDEQITTALRERLRLLPPEHIRDARLKLGMSQHELGNRLGVAEDLVQAWEEGTLLQSRVVDNFLRVYFALPEARALLPGSSPDLLPGFPAPN